MFIDFESLTIAGPNVDHSMSLCTECGEIYSTPSGHAHERSSVPFFDRRPLLLEPELFALVRDKMHVLSSTISEVEDDEEHEFIVNELFPFLSLMLDESRLAVTRRATTGKGYRETSLPPEEALSLLEKIRVPPTSSPF